MKKLILAAGLMFAAALGLCAGLAIHIHFYSAPYIMHAIGGVPPSPVCLVPGARVYGDGRLSIVLRDRCARALGLFRAGTVKRAFGWAALIALPLSSLMPGAQGRRCQSTAASGA